ncbi:MAG: response regulator [Rubellimicrobium sp.]|nr:response regulator [Rubellimicrobium sp.]
MAAGQGDGGRGARSVMSLALLLLGAATLLVLAVLAGDSGLPRPAVVAGLVLLAGALIMAARGTGRLLRQRLVLGGARAMLAAESGPALVADAAGAIRWRNRAAQDADDSGDPAPVVGTMLARIFADPAATARNLQARALAQGSAREDMMTRHGPLGVSVVPLGAGLFLWRLARPERRAAPRDDIALPFLTAGPGGTILCMNAALRRLIGERVHDLRDVFADLPVENGRRHLLKAATGPLSCLVAVVEGSAGRREIYLLPGAAAPEAADWDRVGALPIPLLLLAPDGLIRAANPEARALLPMVIGPATRFADLVEGPGRPVAEWLRDAAEGRGDEQAQFLRGTGAHRDLFLRVTLSPAGDPGDNPGDTPDGSGGGRHVLAILNDVTEYKTLEAQFVQSQKMEAIGQLAGGIAHDFNNLLTAISGHCDLLIHRRDDSDPDWPDLAQIRQNANRAAGLVGQLLAFSRKQSLAPEVLDLRDTLADLAHLLNRLVGEKVHLVLEHDPSLRPVRADPRQLEQVIMNLVVNARDAMPEGGEIRIETENRHLDRPLERDRARVPAGDHVVIRVIDHGAGIPPERIGQIFEPFYTTKRVGEGTGLGLSTAYGIVKQTGGFIFVDSEPGVGTTFSLWFPASRDRPAAPGVAAPADAPRPAAPPCTILLVEDEAPVRAFAARALRLRGHTVIEADSAEAALALLADPDLRVGIFLSDVIMPGKDGPTWVREALADRPETRVIFVSGYADEGRSDHRARIPGAVFLPKPFSLSALAETVRSLAA